MSPSCKSFTLSLLTTLLLSSFPKDSGALNRYKFVVREAKYERLCSSKTILTVNGKFPGPTLYTCRGEPVIVDVFNKANENITLHWHGVKQPRHPWSDGPEYVTQCPIKPGNKFSQKVIFSGEEGTLWWHAHSDWSRATVHGAIIIYPRPGTPYPFPKPYAEVPIILGEWWKKDIRHVLQDFVKSGGQPLDSDAYTINGQPGDLYPCSSNDTFQLDVVSGKTYHFRLVSAVMNEILFFSVAKHKLTVMATDASYSKPLTRDYILIGPGQTLDCLFVADQKPDRYYMVTAPYVTGVGVNFDNTSTTGIVKYKEFPDQGRFSSPPLPHLPSFNDTSAAFNFFGSLRSLATEDHPIDVPLTVNKKFMVTLSINALPCSNASCQGPNGTRLAASMNNRTSVHPLVDILQAYYHNIPGVYSEDFPKHPPFVFNYTADYLPLELEISKRVTQVRTLRYNSTVEIVFQGTNLVAGIDHPIHLHGYSFYVVGWGLGNFDITKDPQKYNLVDPSKRNTITIPRNGWTTIRFKASNPGVWFIHCHLERHLTWGMSTSFIVRDGKKPNERMLPPPPDMPPC